MGKRRELIEGLTEIDPNIDPVLAEEFVYQDDPVSPERSRAQKTAPMESNPPNVPASLPQSVVVAAQVPAASPLTGVGRVPVGARVRTELAAALKTASLSRQLQGIQPNSIQEILEEALELWLLKQGHLK
jgi:hypothetical protein